jgi:hypothetical protein
MLFIVADINYPENLKSRINYTFRFYGRFKNQATVLQFSQSKRFIMFYSNKSSLLCCSKFIIQLIPDHDRRSNPSPIGLSLIYHGDIEVSKFSDCESHLNGDPSSTTTSQRHCVTGLFPIETNNPIWFCSVIIFPLSKIIKKFLVNSSVLFD